MSNLVKGIVDELCDLFPKETAKYKDMITRCVTDLVEALPPGMSPAQYAQVVRENIQLVRDGRLD